MMKSIKDKFLSYSVDKDGVALIEINQKEEPANLLTFDFITRYFEIAKIAIEDKNVKGVIVTSGRPIFMAGGDLRMLAKPIADKKEFFEGIMFFHKGLREIETSGKPFVPQLMELH